MGDFEKRSICIIMSLTAFFVCQGITFDLIVSNSLKKECLKNGGVYTRSQGISYIRFDSCTYTKLKQ